ncbi:hypothetical protein DIPPA_14436 [Diplonema papillatum]|nr:hypothetical protein DIPPA_14436 [Diplonema papillatum]
MRAKAPPAASFRASGAKSALAWAPPPCHAWSASASSVNTSYNLGNQSALTATTVASPRESFWLDLNLRDDYTRLLRQTVSSLLVKECAERRSDNLWTAHGDVMTRLTIRQESAAGSFLSSGASGAKSALAWAPPPCHAWSASASSVNTSYNLGNQSALTATTVASPRESFWLDLNLRDDYTRLLRQTVSSLLVKECAERRSDNLWTAHGDAMTRLTIRQESAAGSFLSSGARGAKSAPAWAPPPCHAWSASASSVNTSYNLGNQSALTATTVASPRESFWLDRISQFLQPQPA